MFDFPSGVEVIWEFRNGHEWSKCFETTAERDHFIYTTGLVSNPDIVRVTTRGGGLERDIKGVRKRHK